MGKHSNILFLIDLVKFLSHTRHCLDDKEGGEKIKHVSLPWKVTIQC